MAESKTLKWSNGDKVSSSRSAPFSCYTATLLAILSIALSLSPIGIFYPASDTSNFAELVSAPVLLLTAHPDDEVMFFAPTIRGLRSSDSEIKVLCLSNGKYFHQCNHYDNISVAMHR
jgi:hypothetical protein